MLASSSIAVSSTTCLIGVRVPHLLLLFRQGLEEAARYDVFNADQPGILVPAVVDDALADLLVQH